ncbi:unnamed protein product, partial [Oppiella nova]
MMLWLVFVTKLGPILMKHRKPLVLREIMMVYNMILVLINAFYVYESLKWLDFGSKSLDPQLPELPEWLSKNESVLPRRIFYFNTKFFDLLDTIFFVLRKKSNQVSFLHVYHHFMGIVMGYIVATVCPQTVILEAFCLLNSTVHTIMYLYYFLSAFGPKIQPYLWWKRYITRLQLIQFVILGIYCLHSLIFRDISSYPLLIVIPVSIQP